MSKRVRKILSVRRSAQAAPLLGFHGCEKTVADKLLAVGAWSQNKSWFKPSQKDYDWLGIGLYFWLDSPLRAYEWVESQHERDKSKSPAVNPSMVGALINPGLCLNLTDYGVIQELQQAHIELQEIFKSAGDPMPANTRLDAHGMPLLRKLDWAVIELVHQLRKDNGLPPYDTVLGFFEEGEMAFDGSSIRAKTHVQIAVRNPDSIVGFFRVI